MTPLPAPPITDQVTALFALPVTLALRAKVFPNCTTALAGETVTTTGGGWSVTVASANDRGFAAAVARTVMLDEAGIEAGAV